MRNKFKPGDVLRVTLQEAHLHASGIRTGDLVTVKSLSTYTAMAWVNLEGLYTRHASDGSYMERWFELFHDYDPAQQPYTDEDI